MYPAEQPRVGQTCAALLLLAAVGLLIPCSRRASAMDEQPPSQHRASGRKYRNLLRKIEVEGDLATYGEFHDWGYWSGTSWRGHTGLPPGYWVYITPYWYIFGESDETPPPVEPPPVGKRSWGPEQVTGEPDTPQAGDHSTAWAASTADGQDEWLRLRYRRAVTPTAVHVYESYNPGALYRITATDSSGRETEIWLGEDPVPVGSGMGKAAVPVATGFQTDCITIYLKSSVVRSWNEIDAVGLLDSSENVQWAVSATASSSYADRTSTGPTPQSNRQRIERLEAEVGSLRTELRLLRAASDRP
jgi:hypothetical protein